MNIDDLLCVGAVDNILVSSTIGRNKLLIHGKQIQTQIRNAFDQNIADDPHQCQAHQRRAQINRAL